MIKSSMRSALKESLMKMKQNGKHERAKSYVKGEGSGSYRNSMVQGSEGGLREKVEDAEEDAMTELEAPSPSEYEGSPEEEMTESEAEAREEGDPPEYRDPEYWREEQKNFMRNRPTAKAPMKSASIVIAVGTGKSNGKKKRG